jgi:hypothetical protein
VESASLCYAFVCLYAKDERNAETFCRRAIAVADRIIADNKCRANDVCEAAYPKNLGVVIRGRAYARWLLGEGLDRAAMRQVSEYMATWCLSKAMDCKRFHDSMTMNVYMEGVRAAMVACDLDRAAELLKTKQKLRWHHGVERSLWRRLIEAYPDIGDGLKVELEVFFDRVRDPDFEERVEGGPSTFINREILALETGIIRQMYVINASPHDDPDPKKVIEAIAR